MEKYCAGCDQTKSIEDFANCKNTKDGKTGKCKECRNKNSKKYRAENKEKVSKYNEQYNKVAKEKKIKQQKIKLKEGVSKRCSTCEKVKLLEDFGKRKPTKGRYKDGYAYICKECAQKMKNNWADKNKQKISDYNKKYRENNKEKVQSYYKVSDEQKQQNKINHRQQYFNKFKKIVEQNGGNCLGTVDDYESAHSKIKVKCKDGHEWETSLNTLNKNCWCPTCSTFTSELIALESCKHLFDKPFVKVKPIWLKNKDDNRLELDIYNKTLKLAVEYNGIQHYKYIKHFHKTKKNYYKRLEDDKTKVQLCEEHDISLIVIPHTVQCNDICKYIYDEAKKLGFNPPNLPKDFDLGTIRDATSKTEKIKDIIQAKGGKLIKGVFVNNESELTIECEKGHQWQTKVKYIQNNKSWCHKCAREMTTETNQKISSTLSTYLQTEKGKANKVASFQKRSQTMAKQRKQARQETTEKECARCHETKPLDDFGLKSAGVLGRQSWCKVCTSEYKKTYMAKKNAQANISN